MKTKELYNTPEMEMFPLLTESEILSGSDGINTADYNYEDNPLGEI